jgi:DNA-binding NarL/FixJ family response regulator
MGPGKRNKSLEDVIKREGINTEEARLSYQQQTVLNLYNCGISPEIIALQLDSTQREVISIIGRY